MRKFLLIIICWFGIGVSFSSAEDQNTEGEFEWFQKGLNQLEDESFDKAVVSFSSALGRGHRLKEYSKFYRAKSYLGLKNWQLAQKDLLEIDSENSHFKLILESRLLLSSVYFEIGQPGQVKSLLTKMLKRVKRTEDEPQVLLVLAKAERLSNSGRGCRYLVQLYKRFPDFPGVQHWDADLDKNEFLGEPTYCQFSIEDFRDRMRALLWAGLDQKAYAEMILVSGRLKEQDPILSDVIRSQFHLQEGDVLKAYELLIPHLEKKLEDSQFLINFAATASRAGDSTAAMGAYLQAASLGKNKHSERAAFLSAVLSYQFQDYDGAERRFQDFVKKYPRSSLAKEAGWHLAWVDYLRGDFERAYSRFSDLAKKSSKNSGQKQRFQYWMAMSLLKMEKGHRAHEIFTRLSQDGLRGYYSLAASSRLARLKDDRSLKSRPAAAPSRWSWSEFMVPSMESTLGDREELDEEESFTTFVLDEDEREQSEEEATLEEPQVTEESVEFTTPALLKRFETAQALKNLNLKEWAKWENYSIEKRTRNKDSLKTLVLDYQKFEQYHRSSQIAHLSFSEERRKQGFNAGKMMWEAAYPRAFRQHVEKWSDKEDVPQEFIWAIMKQESQFKKEAISPVGALGLMQIMPMTGYKMSQLRGDSDFTPQRLLVPESAIELGAAYLKRLLTKFSGEYALAAAAYNAGPHRADLWVSAFGHLNQDEFIEHIPFAETRNYVKKVLTNMQIYRELFDGKKQMATDLSGSFQYRIQGPMSLREDWEAP